MNHKINTGMFDYVAGRFTKYVKFGAAVLWKDRQLSIPLPTKSVIERSGISTMVFIDQGKNEKWTFDSEKVLSMGERKMVGQEPQWYFPIELAVKTPYKQKFLYK